MSVCKIRKPIRRECFRCTAGGHGCVSTGHPQVKKRVPNVLVASLSSVEFSVVPPLITRLSKIPPPPKKKKKPRSSVDLCQLPYMELWFISRGVSLDV